MSSYCKLTENIQKNLSSQLQFIEKSHTPQNLQLGDTLTFIFLWKKHNHFLIYIIAEYILKSVVQNTY